jgi:hypothetical protein
MGSGAVGIRMRLWPALLALLASLLPGELRAQTCTLDPPAPNARIDAAAGTRFFPSGGEGLILVRRKYTDSSIVRVFETDGLKSDPWKQLSERPIISVRPLPDKGYEEFKGFAADNSSVIRFIAPGPRNSFWENRTFVVRICDPGAPANSAPANSAASNSAPVNSLAIVQAPISPPNWAKLISIGFLLLVYVLFATAVYHIRGKPHPLATKYPALTSQRASGWIEHLDPVVLTANAFNKGSIQKLQVLLFTFLISGMVLSLVLTIGALADFSVTIALLLGISAVGAAVAQKTTASHDRLSFENWAWLVKKKILPIHEEDESGPRWSDLVLTNREFDIYKLQTLIFSVVVAGALLAAGAQHLASFSVPDTLLGILGLSQVAYISGTLARPASNTELDHAIDDLRNMEVKLQTVVARNTDTDEDGNLPTPLPAPQPAIPLAQRNANATKAMTLYKKKADQVEVMLESVLGGEVDRNQLEPTLS